MNRLAWFVPLIALSGCDTDSNSGAPRVVQPRLDETELLQSDDLTLGLEFLHQVYEPGRYSMMPGQDPTQLPDVDRLALYHLNQWLAREAKQETDWKPAALLKVVPKSLASIQPLQEIDRAKLTQDDLNFLHGRIWQRDVADRVSKQPLPEPWSSWIRESLTPSLSEEERATTPQQLAAAIQLFDWTIRNIQLDAFPEAEEDAPASAGSQAAGQDVNASPPQRGVPGPGYLRYPYETMLYGHGDTYERARVFIELCRQQGIECVKLAIAQDAGPPRPWAVAALIGADAYLFDAELGLPLRAADGRGVVTLAALQKQPDLLSQLNLDQKRTYWVKSDDLAQLRAFISASPEELSKRMWLLDHAATGAKHLALFVDADALNQRIAKTPSLKGAQVSLWKVPFECSLYVSLGQGLRLRRDKDFAIAFENQTMGLRFPMQPLRQARLLQFRGDFDTSEDALARRKERERELRKQGIPSDQIPPPRDGGAVELYLLSRPEGQSIEQLAYSQQWQQRFGLTVLPNDPEQRREYLEMITARVQRARDDTSYWIALVQYEKGDYANAVKWLKGSLPEDAADEKPWSAGARYNLARCYEALGQTEDAVALYERDDSPQKYGNRLRARWLKQNSGER